MKPLEQQLNTLLDRVCVELGFCTMSDDERASLTKSKQLNSCEFADAVLRAEGSEFPDAEVDWKRRLQRLFVDHFGATEVWEDDFEERGNG